MNWDAIGAVAEVLGAAGVILTLGYLAIQIRQNTQALRAASIDSMTSIANDIRTNLFSDPEIASIYMRGLEGIDNLDALETERFRLLMTNAIWALWNAFTQAQLGDDHAWDAQKPLLRRFLTLPGGEWYWNTYKAEFSSEFRAEVDVILRQAS
ncbi:MAG: hypothetical protein AAF515_18345 [Pseudomonadota bacterium]